MTNRLAILLLLCCLFPAESFADRNLPDLGDSSEPTIADSSQRTQEQRFRKLVHDAPNRINDPLIQAYIAQLGNRLMAVSPPSHIPFQFYVFASPVINAFAGPAHIVVVNSALLSKTSNESELAAVLAHELAHVQQRHLQRMVEHSKNMRIPLVLGAAAAIAVSIAAPGVGSGAMAAGMAGMQQDMINFTREHEQEADRIGIQTLHAAGFDPNSLAIFFNRLQEQERYYALSNIPAILRTHPVNSERIADATNRARQIPGKTYQDSADFAFIKARVTVVANNNSEQTYRQFQLAMQQPKPAPATRYGYALCLLLQERVAEAVAILAELYHEHPENIVLGTTYADGLDQQRHSQEAATLLAKLHRIYPDNVAVILQYADALIATSNRTAAIDLLHRSHFADSHNELIMAKLAQTESNYGSKAMAYFIAAKQMLEQGDALQAQKLLKQAQQLSKKQYVLHARVNALLAEIHVPNNKLAQQ